MSLCITNKQHVHPILGYTVYIQNTYYAYTTYTHHFASPFQYLCPPSHPPNGAKEAVAVMVLAFVPSFVPMIFLRAMSGFFMASLRPVCNALVADARTTVINRKIKGWSTWHFLKERSQGENFRVLSVKIYTDCLLY